MTSAHTSLARMWARSPADVVENAHICVNSGGFGGLFAAGEKKKPVKPATGTPSPKLNGQFLPSPSVSSLLVSHRRIKPRPLLICTVLPTCPGVECVPFRPLVPDDVFAPNYIWKGSYNYRGRKQPMTLSITSFNSTTGRVNVSLSNGNMELLLSGMFGGSLGCLHHAEWIF